MVGTNIKFNSINPYQELGNCPKCSKTNLLFMGGYNMTKNYNAILKCANCGYIYTKLIKNS